MNLMLIKLLFLPKFSSFLNPLVKWFNCVKARMPKVKYSNEDHLMKELKTALDSMNKKLIVKFVN
jgi:hypothetical protein